MISYWLAGIFPVGINISIMTTSNIEITDSAYLITLAKSEFDYGQVRQLLNILFAGRLREAQQHLYDVGAAGERSHELAERFDSLADK